MPKGSDMIKELIEKAIEARGSLQKSETGLRILPATPLDRGVPTLMRGEYRPFAPVPPRFNESAQLRERFELFGRWETATHGHWLGLDDMEALWKDAVDDEFLQRIKSSRVAAEENWPNEASALFRPERLSLFACSDLTNEKIYLLWLDFEDEPELWVYDSNGESRYKDLAEYLTAYL